MTQRTSEKEATVAAYDAAAAAYTAATSAMSENLVEAVDRFAASLPRGARVLEIGTGGGRDANALESAGLSVRRTDVTPAFVERLRAAGHRADVLDPLTDDLSDPERPGAAYDGVWANACLLHLPREDMPAVLARLAETTCGEGVLYFSVKEGDGEAWSTHGAVDLPRFFTYWREPDLVEVVGAAGWRVTAVEYADGNRGERWLMVNASRR